jgi:hypothetical protein
MSTNINFIITEIFKYNSPYKEIINISMHKYKISREYKSQLISDIAIDWLQKPQKVIEAYDDGKIVPYLYATFRNQLYSSSSPFYVSIKNQFKNIDLDLDMNLYDSRTLIDSIGYDEALDEIEYKELKEFRLDKINEALSHIECTWFQQEIFREYMMTNRSYSAMSEEYSISINHLFKTVTLVKKKIIQYLSENEIL